MKRPLQFAVYKGMGGKFGAVQLNYQRPHYYRDKEKDFTGEVALDASGRLKDTEGWKQREGAVFLEATSTSGPNSYDWERKITVALSVVDMGKLALALTTGNKTELMHDPNAKTPQQGNTIKRVTLESESIVNKGAILTVSQITGGSTTRHVVPLSPDECLVIRELLRTAISKAMAWE